MLLNDRVAVITGGGGGIGRAVAMTLAGEGARVVVADIVKEKAEAAAQEVCQKRGEAEVVAVDVSREKEAEALIRRTVERFGRVDILVNAAAILRHAGVFQVTEEELDEVFAVNVKGTLFCSRAAAQQMIKQKSGGAIVNFSSVAGKIPRINQTAYALSKAAVIHLTKMLALELARHGVRVNVIAPGPTDTPMMRGGRTEEQVNRMIRGDVESYRMRVPLGRVLTPQEQANAVLYLVSDLASAVTGHVLFADGGEGMF